MDNSFVFVKGGRTIRSRDYSGQNKGSVCIPDFYISKFQVTQGLYFSVINNNPSNFHDENAPVEMVSWFDAVFFCNETSRRKNLLPYYLIEKNIVRCRSESTGYRLPTEEEWEYAASGGNKSNGYGYSGSNDPDLVAWYKKNSGDKTHPVGQKGPNELGIYDMSGNVWEWCFDSGPDPEVRIYKGGSFLDFGDACKISCRGQRSAKLRQIDIGFRLVKNICPDTTKSGSVVY